jgi:hypothetical protein
MQSPVSELRADGRELAAEVVGLPVAVTNLATNDGLESDVLLHRVKRT